MCKIATWIYDCVSKAIHIMYGIDDTLVFFFQIPISLETMQLDAHAVCIENVQVKFPPIGPNLDLNLLEVFFTTFCNFNIPQFSVIGLLLQDYKIASFFLYLCPLGEHSSLIGCTWNIALLKHKLLLYFL
jgi:hypothetical protein